MLDNVLLPIEAEFEFCYWTENDSEIIGSISATVDYIDGEWRYDLHTPTPKNYDHFLHKSDIEDQIYKMLDDMGFDVSCAEISEM